MRRLGVLLRLVLAVVLAQLAWTWVQRHDSDLRLRRLLAGRRARPPHSVAKSGTSARIVQFYARAGEIVEGETDVICYGVENVQSLKLDPPVANVSPALVRCFSVEPKWDTSYTLFAEGRDGSRDEATFAIRVRPAPPLFRMMAVSDKAIPAGEVVTVCYGVEHATGVVLHPIGWRLPASGSRNCVRFYPKATTDFTLIASGTAGLEAKERFRVAVTSPASTRR
jgi:hypothetical protein